MKKILSVIDWVEYGSKALKAIAGGFRTAVNDWPDRPASTVNPVATKPEDTGFSNKTGDAGKGSA